MLKAAKYGLVLFLVLTWSVGIAFAADQDRDRDRKKDGTCQSYTAEQDNAFILAGKRKGQGKGSGDRDRKKDGSC